MANLIFLGSPGAGKGTQAKKYASFYECPHISTGDIFRSALQNKTILGIEAYEKYWGKGQLVPDEVTNPLAFERLQQSDCLTGFILDGYPRTLPQAKALNDFLKDKKSSLDAVINFQCPESLLIDRILSRETCKDCGAIYGLENKPTNVGQCDTCPGKLYHRSDDNAETLKKRLVEYDFKTKPLIDFYQKTGLLTTIDASLDGQKVFSEIEKITARCQRNAVPQSQSQK